MGEIRVKEEGVEEMEYRRNLFTVELDGSSRMHLKFDAPNRIP